MQRHRAAGKGRADGETLQDVLQCSRYSGEAGDKKKGPAVVHSGCGDGGGWG